MILEISCDGRDNVLNIEKFSPKLRRMLYKNDEISYSSFLEYIRFIPKFSHHGKFM